METGHSPDGGWGWMVVLGAALINMVNQALFSTFGLIFGEELKAMANGKATGITLVLAISSMVTNFTGLTIGPLMKRLSVSSITVAGVVCVGTGMILSSFATEIYHIVLAYGCLTGFGLGLLSAVTFLAISQYFTKRKNTAVGLAMAGTGIGQMLMPLLVGVLLKTYKFTGTTFILGFVSYSGLIGALFFKRPRWCTRRKENDSISSSTSTRTTISQNVELIKENNLDHNKKQVLPTDINENSFSDSLRRASQSESDSEDETEINEALLEAGETYFESSKQEFSNHVVNNGKEMIENGEETENPKPKGFFRKLIHTLDLALLTDFRFAHILIGLSITYVSTVTFSAFFPMFLQDELNFGMYETSTCMTALSFADILGRTTVSEVSRIFKLSSRSSFMVGAIVLGLCRSCLVELTAYKSVIVVSFIVGYCRASTVININLVVSDYVDKSRLPAALGLNMVGKGIFVISLGQSLGLLKDAFSYRICIHILNVIIILMAISWTIEIAISRGWCRCKEKRRT